MERTPEQYKWRDLAPVYGMVKFNREDMRNFDESDRRVDVDAIYRMGRRGNFIVLYNILFLAAVGLLVFEGLERLVN